MIKIPTFVEYEILGDIHLYRDSYNSFMENTVAIDQIKWDYAWTPDFSNDVVGANLKEMHFKENPDGKIHSIKSIKVLENGDIQHGTDLFDFETFLEKCKPVL